MSERAEWAARAAASIAPQHLPWAAVDDYVTVTLRGDGQAELLRQAADWIDANAGDEGWAVVHGIECETDPLSTPAYQVNIRITGDNAD